MFPTPRQKSLLVATIVAIACSFAVGCEQTDWNWDPQWWQKPRRVIRPTDPRAMESDPPARSDPHTVNVSRPTSRTDAPDAPPTPTPVADVPNPVSTPTRASPFRRLFLISGAKAPERGSADAIVRLTQTTAESCARLLESLYVPTARLGSAEQSYLMFEESDAFDAARTFAAQLDAPIVKAAVNETDGPALFRSGVGMFYAVLDEGPLAARALIQGADQRLAEAADSSSLDGRLRWAAAILAGRLALDFRYDYEAAGRHFKKAAELSDDASIERMTARGWMADTLVKLGNETEARSVFESIVSEFARWPRSPAVLRARSWLEEHQ